MYDSQEPITIRRGALMAIFDLATHSLDFGSGFWNEEDVYPAREVAVLLGVDPMVATPRNYAEKFSHPFKTNKFNKWCSLCNKEKEYEAHNKQESEE